LNKIFFHRVFSKSLIQIQGNLQATFHIGGLSDRVDAISEGWQDENLKYFLLPFDDPKRNKEVHAWF
jgi:hypothetical protein